MAKNPTQVHYCPKVPDGFTRKMTGPAWNGESTEEAISMWFAWGRNLEAHCRKMPRTTTGERPGSERGRR
jgi:hypothetical protein